LFKNISIQLSIQKYDNMQKGTIGVSTDNIFPVIKKFLYSDHEIFLREIVSNAVDASQKLKTLASVGEYKEELSDLKVYVKVDSENKTLTVSDNGIGMTAQEIDQYINQIAFSGAEEFLEKYKEDANAIIGHFGLGFYSTFMVSKQVDIITKSWKEGSEAVKWSCDGSPEYALEKVEKAERGTDIVLHIDDENLEFLQESKINELLSKYCKFLPIPIVFGKKKEWKDGNSVETDEDNQINETKPAWTRKPSELDDEAYLKFYKDLYPFSEDPLFHIHLNVDYPFNLTGILYFPKVKSGVDLQKNKIQLYSNQVFVTDSVENIVPDFLTLLHGVIDSPDIPLNVSRSYLQSDANVKKISGHITRKVADKLFDLFKNDRSQFESKWSDLKVFIEYGILTDEKFWDKAQKFCLLQNVEGKSFTLDEYQTLIRENQTDKDGQLICLYASDKNAQYAQTQAAVEKGYDVLLMDGQLDVHFVGKVEQHFEKCRFVRVDSNATDHLINKQEKSELTLTDEEKESLQSLISAQLPQIEKTEFKVQLENLGEANPPVTIALDEFMRRMQEMAAMNPGLNFYGEMPTNYQVIVNVSNPKIKSLMDDTEGKESMSKQLIDLALLSGGLLKGEALNQFVKRTLEMLH
jgi:molecular chaperone HtpG